MSISSRRARREDEASIRSLIGGSSMDELAIVKKFGHFSIPHLMLVLYHTIITITISPISYQRSWQACCSLSALDCMRL
jgi:hypothetical protein